MTERRLFRVLFVDDEARILDGLRRQYRSMKNRWEMQFAESGKAAIEILEKEAIDVVVTDMKMPQMNGAQLLEIVRERWPSTIRFVLSGQTDQSDLVSHIGSIHQFIQKPCEPEQLELAIRQTHRLSNKLASKELRGLAGRLESLPVISSIYDDLLDVLDDDACCAESVGKVVSRDMGLSTKLLQMVNSAFFGLPRRVSNVKDAVVLIGMSNIRQLMTASQIYDALANEAADSHALAKLWQSGSDIGSLASQLASAQGSPPEVRDAARIAGTLSLVGRAILIWGMPEMHKKAVAMSGWPGILLHEAEREVFGANQQSLGAYALGLWAFDVKVVESVLYQVDPQEHYAPSTNIPMLYVHAARANYPESQLTEDITLQAEILESNGIRIEACEKERGAA